MDIAVQYLEGGSPAPRVSPLEARACLRAAFERLPFAMVLLGWDLDPRVVEACAEECALRASDLYLWQPLLTGHGPWRPDPAWRVVGLHNGLVAGHGRKPEFTFICPNRPSIRERVLQNLGAALAGGHYRGVFLDRIRFPSPAADPASRFGCFCDACRKAARQVDLDLTLVRADLLRLLSTREGKHAAIRGMLSMSGGSEPEGPFRSLARVLAFRQRSVSALVKEAAAMASAQGLKVGLDCYSPTLAPMVGQDLAVLGEQCDWIKVMTYVRAYGPASLPFEILALANWLIRSTGKSEAAALDFLAEATGWSLPTSREEVREGRMSASILTEELQRAQIRRSHPLFAGMELVEIPGVAQLSTDQIREDAEAVLAGAPDGIVLSWDLWHMPLDRLELVSRLYRRPTHRPTGGKIHA